MVICRRFFLGTEQKTDLFHILKPELVNKYFSISENIIQNNSIGLVPIFRTWLTHEVFVN
jgi:hypothetical protein